MIWSKNLKKNIFCLEGEWESDLKHKNSIKSVLDLISKNLEVDFIYRNMGIKDNLFHYLKEFSKDTYKDYTILYLATHGLQNGLHTNDDFVELDEIAEICKGKLKNKIIYFGSCLTLKINDDIIQKFLKKTKALAVCGYKSEVDFLHSTALDILIIEALQNHKDMRKISEEIKKYSQMIKFLKFTMIY